MKSLFILLFCLLSVDGFAKTLEVDVLSAEYGVEDHLQKKTLCLTVVRLPSNGELLGVVEDIGDCFYARMAKRSPDHKIRLNVQNLRSLEMPELHDHLQSLDTQLKFLFSDGE